LALIVAVSSCSESSNNPAGPGGDGSRADVTSAVGAFPSWETVSPQVTETEDSRIGDRSGGASFLSDSDPRYNPSAVCVATEYTLAKNPREIITLSPDQGILVPGVLVQGKSHVVGTLNQLRIDERAPIDLVIDDASATAPSRTVEVPNLGTLQTGVNSLIQDAETSGFEGSSSVVFDKVTSYSREQAAMGLNFSARYLGASAQGQLQSRTSGSETTVTASFVQRAFTITADAPPFIDEWFTGDLTQDRLNRYIDTGQMGPDNPPLYVQSVTYGRIVMVNFTSTESRERIEGFFEAGYSNKVGDLSVEVRAEYERMIRDASISVVSLGGPAEGGFQFAKEVLSPNDPNSIGLEGFFAQDVPLTAFVPISYVLADMRTDEVAFVGETSEHEVLECGSRAESDFESSMEGWEGVDIRFGWPELMDDPNEARNGSGALIALDGNNQVTYLRAPAKFLGDKEVYMGGELSYYTKVWCAFNYNNGARFEPYESCSGRSYGFISSTTWPELIIEGEDSPLTLIGRAARNAFVPDTWEQRVISLAPGDLQVYNSSAGQSRSDARPATAAQVREVLSNISRLLIRAEFAGNETDFVVVDLVRFDPPAVPTGF
jgi:hypothetical protein